MIGMDLVLGGAPGMVGGVARGVISRAGMFGGALDFMASPAGSMGASLVDAVAWYGGRNRFSFFAKGAQIGAESAEIKLLLESPRDNLLRSVENNKLRNITARMYRENAEVASGSTADAIRHEIRTGELLSPSGHIQKGVEMRSALSKLIDSGRLSQSDQNIARWMRRDIQDALSEERIHTQTMRNGY